MKLGVSYNIFDGEELLKSSISYIRDQVDYISGVYQMNSWFGVQASDNLLETLNQLVDQGYIDELVEYNSTIDKTLNPQNAHLQQVEKRNVGLELSKRNNCTHHMPMDIDEFYEPDQFRYMKKEIDNSDFDASACKHKQYYKDSIYLIAPSEEEYVGLIYKINDDSKFAYWYPCEVPIDPSRKINNSNYKIFNRSEIEMHHMSFVRKDLRKKLLSSIARGYIDKNIDKIVDYYNNWKYPEPAMWAGGNLLQVVQVDRKFQLGDV
jgi:hypothetical protein